MRAYVSGADPILINDMFRLIIYSKMYVVSILENTVHFSLNFIKHVAHLLEECHNMMMLTNKMFLPSNNEQKKYSKDVLPTPVYYSVWFVTLKYE